MPKGSTTIWVIVGAVVLCCVSCAVALLSIAKGTADIMNVFKDSEGKHYKDAVLAMHNVVGDTIPVVVYRIGSGKESTPGEDEVWFGVDGQNIVREVGPEDDTKPIKHAGIVARFH